MTLKCVKARCRFMFWEGVEIIILSQSQHNEGRVGPYQSWVCAVKCYSSPLSGPWCPLIHQGCWARIPRGSQLSRLFPSPIKKQPDSCLSATCFLLSLHFPLETQGEHPAAFWKIAGKANNPAVECWKVSFCKPPFLIRNCNPAKIGLNLCDVR